MKKPFITHSCGNVFLDLGFPPHEAALLKMRGDLMNDICKHIKAKKLTQAAAAKLLGVAQPRVSDLVRGKFVRFSLDTLISFAMKLGLELTLKSKAA